MCILVLLRVIGSLQKDSYQVDADTKYRKSFILQCMQLYILTDEHGDGIGVADDDADFGRING